MSVGKIRFAIVLTLTLIALLSPACAKASALYTEERPLWGLFFIDSVEEESLASFNLLILTDAEISGEADVIILALGGNIIVDGNVNGIIFTFLSDTVSTGNVKYGIIDVKYMALPFDLIVGLAVLAIFKDFMEQSAAYFIKNTKSVVKFGLYGYMMYLILVGVFIISVSGAVFALAGLAGLAAVTLAGRLPIAVIIGNRLCARLESYNVYILYAAGITVLDVIRIIPVIGDISAFVILPLLSLGIFSVHVIHKYFYRAYVLEDFEKHREFNREKLSSIILKRGE